MKLNTSAYLGSVAVMGALLVACKTEGDTTLGHFPLCEASAALTLPCPDSKGLCLLVGDNEQRKELFLLPVKDGVVSSEAQETLNLKLKDDDELSDIEALAPIDADKILVFGSHSRNTKCEERKNRRRFATVQISNQGAVMVQHIQSKKITCERLFGEIPQGDAVLRAACTTIDSAEKKAKKLEKELEGHKLTKDQEKKAKARCNEILPYNAEGAVAIPRTDGTDVWIGLRAPLLVRHPDRSKHKDLAMLLRMKDLTGYEFDRIALLNLDGRGVRELAYAEDSVWVIAGPPEDKKVPFQLRRFPKEALNGKEIIEPEFVDNLPSSSEGLAIHGKTAYVVIDGDTGTDDAARSCGEPSRYKKIILP